MRPDMAKLIVERPRKGGGCKYPRARVHRLRCADFADAPTHEPHKSRFFHCRKFFNENLAPLRRFLRKNLGRPWTDVHAEIAAQVPNKSTINHHVWQHIHWDVNENVLWYNGQICALSGHLEPPRPTCGFYVDPDTGLLQEVRRHYKREEKLKKITEADPATIPVTDTLEYHLLNNVWFAVTFAPTPRGFPVFDVLQKRFAYPSSYRYPAAKRQLAKREIKRLITPRLQSLARQRQRAEHDLERLQKARPPRRAFPFLPNPVPVHIRDLKTPIPRYFSSCPHVPPAR